MQCSLDRQVAIVTGASSGIGHGVARALAQAGAAVSINYNSHGEPARALAREIVQAGGRAIAIGADVSDEASVLRLFDETVSAFGAVDVVVANSGMQKDAPSASMTLEDWNKVIGVNLTGQFLTAREAIRRFEKQGDRGVSRALGKIICMSSVHEVIPWAGHVNYAASKGGIAMMMRTLAQEMAPSRIRINAIAPGAIRTAINKQETEGEAAGEAAHPDPLQAHRRRRGRRPRRGVPGLRHGRLHRRHNPVRRWRHDALSGLRRERIVLA